MPKNTAECGKREERAIVKELERHGYRARRQPGSGNVDPTLPHDVVWEDSPIGKLLIESKWRASCGWRTLLKWMEGAPLLVLKSSGAGSNQHQSVGPEGERYVFMKWDTLMALVGDATQRAEAADLGAQVTTPDKPWLSEADLAYMPDSYDPLAIAQEQDRRAKIQDFHQNAKPRPPKGSRKMQGRKFSNERL